MEPKHQPAKPATSSSAAEAPAAAALSAGADPAVIAAAPLTPAAPIGAVEENPQGVIGSAAQDVVHAAVEVEEEVEAKAAIGFLGGPIVWGLLVILALAVVYVIAS